MKQQEDGRVQSPKQVSFIGSYIPRQCGIATFTSDLYCGLTAEGKGINSFAVAVNDVPEGYDYPPEVRFEIPERDIASYRRAADFLNVNNVDLVCLQHEYGIYGGPAGSHILALLSELRMPIVTTLHTVLQNPDPSQLKVMKELIRLSDRLIVMSQHGATFLREVYGAPPEKVNLIPHGIPDVPFVDPNFYKDKFGAEGKVVLLTFGLLSPNKGIENVIEALPRILQHYPDLMYIVLGATHPNIVRTQGESYRLQLQRLARDKGVNANVVFHNRFVSLQELVEFIGAADIYLTPYLNPAQVVSGTLAYAVGAAKAVISTPYWYAEDLLADGRGILVPFNDSGAIADQVIDLLDNETKRHAMRKKAYLLGREMIWSRVADRYLEVFEQLFVERRKTPRAFAVSRDNRPTELPLLNLDHLRRMTDHTGLLQHAIYSTPNFNEGYSTDDNVRALILTVLLEETEGGMTREVDQLAERYMALIWYAFDPQTGRFRNFLSYDRHWLEEVGSEDCQGQSVWALGTVLGRSHNEGLCGVASRMFEPALQAAVACTAPRAWAFTLLGIHEYFRRFAGDRVAQEARLTLAERLLTLFYRTSTESWPWFEDKLTYVNAKLPHALLLSGRWLERNDMTEAALKSLTWLADLYRTEEDYFSFIGNKGFYHRDGERAIYDQQPIEAQAMVSACLEAYRITGDERWHKDAHCAFEWFLGRNARRLALYDPFTGGCRDGLQPAHVNPNQGAESTLAFLLSRVEMQLSEYISDAEHQFA